MSDSQVDTVETSPAGWPRWAICLQFRVVFDDPAANLALVRQRLAELAPAAGSLVVLPELWAAGFAYPSLARQAARTPELLAALAAEAADRGITVAGSLPEAAVATDGGYLYYNTLYLVEPAGVAGKYRKQRLFAPLGEDRYFRAGTDDHGAGEPRGPLPAAWGPVAALVCFDLRFPELATAQVDRGAELLLVSAQWPRARRQHWRVLLQARAIENQIFVVACNTCGRVGESDFAGTSMIIAPDGEVLAEAGGTPQALGAPLDFSRLAAARRLFRTRSPGPTTCG